MLLSVVALFLPVVFSFFGINTEPECYCAYCTTRGYTFGYLSVHFAQEICHVHSHSKTKISFCFTKKLKFHFILRSPKSHSIPSPFSLDASNFFTIISLEKGGISIEDIKLDFSLRTIEERNAAITDLLSKHPDQKFTPRQLEYFGDYIIGALSKEEKKEKTILTENRLVTINKRETSYEGLVSKFENGEDGLSNLITNDKNILLVPKISITAEDLAEVPGLAALREAIEQVEAECAAATGRRKFLLKKQLIEMRKDQYILKTDYRSPIGTTSGARGGLNKIDLAEKIFINSAGEPQSSGLVSLFDPAHISAILRNYPALKAETASKFQSDFYYLMLDFDNLLRKTIQHQYPMYYDLFIWKTKGKSNAEIQTLLLEKYETKYSLEYISSLWRNKIPKLLAEQAKEDYLIWYYTEVERGKWKTCSCCGEVKLAHPKFFTRNKTSKDGWYSQCKKCRNAKNKDKKI